MIDRHATETNTLPQLLQAHGVARVAIAFLPYLDLHRHFAVGHVGAIDAQVPPDAAGPRHWPAQTVGEGLLRIEIAHALGARLEDVVAADEPLQFTHVLLQLIQVGFA